MVRRVNGSDRFTGSEALQIRVGSAKEELEEEKKMIDQRLIEVQGELEKE